MQISEMGMLYRQVATFIDSREAGISKGGMTEQVSRGGRRNTRSLIKLGRRVYVISFITSSRSVTGY